MVTPHRKQFITTQKTWGNKSGSIEVRVSKRTFFYFKDEQTLTLFLTTQLIPLWMIVESISGTRNVRQTSVAKHHIREKTL